MARDPSTGSPYAPTHPRSRKPASNPVPSAPAQPSDFSAVAQLKRASRLYAVPGQHDGLVEQGNIDLARRPRVKNPDGSISTVRSISIGVDGGRTVLIPTVVGNRVVPVAQAISHYQRTGKHLGVFASEQAANKYAEALHREQAAAYPNTPARSAVDQVVGFDPGLGVSVTRSGKSLDVRGNQSPTVTPKQIGKALDTGIGTALFGVPLSQTNYGKLVQGEKPTLSVNPPKGSSFQEAAAFSQQRLGATPFPAGKGLKNAAETLLGKAEKAAETGKPLPPPGLGTPEAVSKKLESAKRLRRQQEAGYSQERAKRAAMAEQAMKVGGQEGYQAALGKLKGELPKLRFGGFENMGQDGVDALFTHIQQHPTLRTFDKIRTQKAVFGVLEGRVPTRSEIRLLEQTFGKTATQDIKASVPFWAKAKNTAFELLNVPRSLMSSFDLSAPFRQGLMVGVSHPRLFFRNFKSMFKAFGSEKAYQAIHEDIVTRPTYPLMEKAGLSLTELGPLELREEQFLGGNYAEKIPVAGIGVRMSGRAYTGFLNKTRADLFDHLVAKADQQGLDIENEKLLKSIARFVNSATGRGDLGAMQKHALGLNALMFSPRLLWSRLNFMNPVYYARLDPFARREALKAAAGLVGTVSTVLALAKAGGAKVNMDPRNADWAKIRIGDTRIDVLGGFQQPARLIAQLTSGKIISSTTGETLTLGPQGPGKLSRRDILQRFAESKLSPVPSLVNDLFKGTDFEGKPFSWKKAAVQRMLPLLAQDVEQLYADGGLLTAVGAYGVGAFGLGIQTYGPRPTSAPSGNPYAPASRSGVSPYAPSRAGGGSPYGP